MPGSKIPVTRTRSLSERGRFCMSATNGAKRLKARTAINSDRKRVSARTKEKNQNHEKTVPIAGFSRNPIPDRIETDREKCPKCDGKGMVKEEQIHLA